MQLQNPSGPYQLRAFYRHVFSNIDELRDAILGMSIGITPHGGAKINNVSPDEFDLNLKGLANVA